ncbi:hypothetical protein L5515_002492 [Caenorhabditis briggsae]|uniref:Uncharacterized protein n=2 Tax=Caenorhabditis briggsae TaxID=6238 RepID=A0AAE9J5R8_CAEBR|nr:hypothetical protein L5515_002492 [Caenorhabditis briggsae]
MDKLRELGIVRATKEQLSSGTLFRIYRADGKSASLQIGRYFYFNASEEEEEEEEEDSDDSDDSDDDEDIEKIDLKKSYKDQRGDNFGDLTEEDVSSDSSGWHEDLIEFHQDQLSTLQYFLIFPSLGYTDAITGNDVIRTIDVIRFFDFET